MPRSRNLIETRRLNTVLPKDLLDRVDQLLWSESKGKVAFGAYQELLTDLLKLVVDGATLDLADFVREAPHGSIVRADRRVIEILRNALG